MARASYTKDEIRQRLKTVQASLTSVLTKIFAADVADGLVRTIVAIELEGDQTASRTVKVAYSGSGTGARSSTIFPTVPLGPAEEKWLPPGAWDVENALATLMGGENLSASVSAGTGASITVYYWDSDTT